MTDQTIVNYDELQRFAKHFDSESEVIAETQSKLRQQAHELETEWVGKGSEKFFNEFETEILPAMGRLHNALTLTADTLRKIMKIFDEAENETASYFKGSNFDSGLRAASMGNIGVAAVGGRQFRTPQQGGTAQGVAGGSSGIDVSNLDFGMDGVEINEPGGVPTGDSGEIKAETPAFEQAEAFEEMEPTENTEATAAGGGGGGGTGGSQGIQGDLKMGVGSSNQSSAAQSGGIGGGAQPMADHVYGGGGSTGGMQTPEADSAQASAGTPDANKTDAGEIAGTAGVLGGAGVAAGASAKKMKNKNEDE